MNHDHDYEAILTGETRPFKLFPDRPTAPFAAPLSLLQDLRIAAEGFGTEVWCAAFRPDEFLAERAMADRIFDLGSSAHAQQEFISLLGDEILRRRLLYRNLKTKDYPAYCFYAETGIVSYQSLPLIVVLLGTPDPEAEAYDALPQELRELIASSNGLGVRFLCCTESGGDRRFLSPEI